MRRSVTPRQLGDIAAMRRESVEVDRFQFKLARELTLLLKAPRDMGFVGFPHKVNSDCWSFIVNGWHERKPTEAQAFLARMGIRVRRPKK